MANPQAENGHVDIANDIIEELARHRLSGEQWQCLLVVWRKTYGWHKKEDEISLTTFEVMTGMKRANVVRTLKKLVAKKILGSSNIDTRYAKKYWFIKDFDQWQASIKKDTTSSNNDTPPVSILITQPVAKKLHSKENSSKETITKENTFELFWKEYPKKKGKGQAEKAWAKLKEPEETLELIRNALVWQKELDDWVKDAGKYIPYPATYLSGKRWLDEETEDDDRHYVEHDAGNSFIEQELMRIRHFGLARTS